MNTTAGPLIQRWGARTVILGVWTLAMLAGPFGEGAATAEPIQLFKRHKQRALSMF
jgi:hypothetical protein